MKPVTYTQEIDTIEVSWEDYEDKESGIVKYEVSLWQNSSCSLTTSTEILLVDWIKLGSGNFTGYKFVDLALKVIITVKV